MTIEDVIDEAISAIPDTYVRAVVQEYRRDLTAFDEECRRVCVYEHERCDLDRDLIIGRANLRLGRALGKVGS